MLDFYVWINSYNREKKINNLLHALLDQLSEFKTHIQVYLDGCSYNSYVFGVSYTQCEHHGKENYYKLCQRGIKELQPAKYYLKLDDDMVIKPDFIQKAVECFESIRDSKKIALNLLKDYRSDMWGSGEPKIYNNKVLLTQWTDLNFMANTRLYHLKDEIIFYSRPDYVKSSGVGRQFTRILRKKGNIYQVKETLLFHGDHKSEMNPERKEKLTNI